MTARHSRTKRKAQTLNLKGCMKTSHKSSVWTLISQLTMFHFFFLWTHKMLFLVLKCKAAPVLWAEVPQASPWAGISQCHVTRAGWKSESPIPLNFPLIFSKFSWGAMGEARREHPPRHWVAQLIRCFQGHVRPIPALLGSAFHHELICIFFPSFFQILPCHKQLPRATGSHFLRVSNTIQAHACSFPNSSGWSITSVQCLLPDCHLSLNLSLLLLQVLFFSPCVPSPPRCVSNFKSTFSLPVPSCSS